MATRDTDTIYGTASASVGNADTDDAAVAKRDTVLSEDDENLMHAYDGYWENFQGLFHILQPLLCHNSHVTLMRFDSQKS